MPRTTPYTEIGIRRVPCTRCGRPSNQQWNICALGRRFYGLCTDCDVELNRVVLKFIGLDPVTVESIIGDYKRRLNGADH